jgi:2-polyprenyl-3-methyl-5-hydroxy-6-metoxy-1,4-benzoquinol methylase
MPPTPMDRARLIAERAAADAQGRNRAWWEALPMTYEPWEAAERASQQASSSVELEQTFRDSNPWLRDHFDFTAFRGSRVLEIGSGAGAASCLFAAAGAEVTAVDLTQAAVELTKRNALARGLSIEVQQMDAESLAFADGSFDVVFSWGVLHHTAHTEVAINEVARVLRPRGRALIMVYNRASLRYYLRGLQWLILKRKLFTGDRLSTVQRHYTDGYFHRHFTGRELRKICRTAGLSVSKVSVSHMAKRLVPMVPRVVDEWLKRRAGWLLVVEAFKEG